MMPGKGPEAYARLIPQIGYSGDKDGYGQHQAEGTRLPAAGGKRQT